MKTNILITSICLILISCNRSTNSQLNGLVNRPENTFFKKYQIFDDKNYLLTLTTFDTTNSYMVDKTVIVNLLRRNKDKIDTLINDSLFSRNAMGAVPEIRIEFKDFNFDAIKDIAIPAGTDPRGNSGFHLYIVDNLNKSIQYVNGFNEIGNPKADSIYKIIQSFVLAGPPFCRFFEINTKNEVIDLGHYIEFLDFDSIDSKIHGEMKKIKTFH